MREARSGQYHQGIQSLRATESRTTLHRMTQIKSGIYKCPRPQDLRNFTLWKISSFSYLRYVSRSEIATHGHLQTRPHLESPVSRHALPPSGLLVAQRRDQLPEQKCKTVASGVKRVEMTTREAKAVSAMDLHMATTQQGQFEGKIRAYQARVEAGTAHDVDEPVHKAAEDMVSTSSKSTPVSKQCTRTLVPRLCSELKQELSEDRLIAEQKKGYVED